MKKEHIIFIIFGIILLSGLIGLNNLKDDDNKDNKEIFTNYIRFIPDEQEWSYEKECEFNGYEKDEIGADLKEIKNSEEKLDEIWKSRAAYVPEYEYGKNTMYDKLVIQGENIKRDEYLLDGRNRKFLNNNEKNRKDFEGIKRRIKKVLERKNSMKITDDIQLPRIVSAEQYYNYFYDNPFIPYDDNCYKGPECTIDNPIYRFCPGPKMESKQTKMESKQETQEIEKKKEENIMDGNDKEIKAPLTPLDFMDNKEKMGSCMDRYKQDGDVLCSTKWEPHNLYTYKNVGFNYNKILNDDLKGKKAYSHLFFNVT